TATAAADVESVSMVVAAGRCLPSQHRTCAAACGWVATVRTSAAPLSGRTRTLNCTGSTASATASTGSPSTIASRVAGTDPSTEFSTGTHAPSTWRARSAAIAACTDTAERSSSPGTSTRAACSANVPSGPRYAVAVIPGAYEVGETNGGAGSQARHTGTRPDTVRTSDGHTGHERATHRARESDTPGTREGLAARCAAALGI